MDPPFDAPLRDRRGRSRRPLPHACIAPRWVSWKHLDALHPFIDSLCFCKCLQQQGLCRHQSVEALLGNLSFHCRLLSATAKCLEACCECHLAFLRCCSFAELAWPSVRLQKLGRFIGPWQDERCPHGVRSQWTSVRYLGPVMQHMFGNLQLVFVPWQYMGIVSLRILSPVVTRSYYRLETMGIAIRGRPSLGSFCYR